MFEVSCEADLYVGLFASGVMIGKFIDLYLSTRQWVLFTWHNNVPQDVLFLQMMHACDVNARCVTTYSEILDYLNDQ